MEHRTPFRYVELVGATTENEYNTLKAQYFTFGGILCHIAKSRCMIKDGKFYAESYVARQSVGAWLGEFIPGSQYAMRPINGSVIATMSKIIKMIEQGNALVTQGNAIIKQALTMAQDIPNAELDEETARLVQLIKKHATVSGLDISN